MPDPEPGGSSPTLYDKLRRRLLDQWWVAVAVLAAGAIVYGVQVWTAVKDVVKTSPAPVTMLTTVDDDAAECALGFAIPGRAPRKRSVIDVGINNQSDRDIFLKRVRLVPDRVTGGFVAGELPPGATYDVSLAGWFDMVMVAKGVGPQGADGQAALVQQGVARKEKRDGDTIWWVTPEPIEVTAIPAGKYTVKKQSQERFRIRLGLRNPVDVVEGRIRLDVDTDAGERLSSHWLDIAVCNGAGVTKPR